MIKFSTANMKLAKIAKHLGIPKAHVVSFDLPAGHTCPAASLCYAKTVKDSTGKRYIEHGSDMLFECYAARAERNYTNTYDRRHENWESIAVLGNDSDAIAELLQSALPKRAKVVRIHSSGDFFSKAYFNAWLILAKNNPSVQFFGYTKIIHYARMANNSGLDNIALAYSFGGKLDHMVGDDDMVSYVIMSDDISGEYGTGSDGTTVPMACTADHDTAHVDYLYIIEKRGSFGLELH